MKKTLLFAALQGFAGIPLLFASPGFASPLEISPNSLYITPNPCITGSRGVCDVELRWHTSVDSAHNNNEIWVGNPDTKQFQLMACQKAGAVATIPVPWIEKGKLFEFRLYPTSGCPKALPAGNPLASVTVTGIEQAPVFPEPSVGLNKPDLATQYLGRASRGDGSKKYQGIETEMAKKALADAKRTGAKFVRVWIMGYAPLQYSYGNRNDLDLWQNSPESYWNIINQMMDDLEREKISLVPSFAFNIQQIPFIKNEKVTNMINDTSGNQSFPFLKSYIEDFILKYKDRHYIGRDGKEHKTIYFYELGNELNLRNDLDMVARCQKTKTPDLCAADGNFSTNEMIAFSTRLASYIRTLDSTRPITSGFAIPRSSAQHLRAHPETSSPPGDWRPDSAAEFAQNLIEIHQGIDLIDTHYYLSNNVEFKNYFDDPDKADGNPDPKMLAYAKSAADAVGKKLYIGEFGDNTPDPATELNPEFPFASNVLKRVQELGIPYSSPWAWEYYQRSLDYRLPNPNFASVREQLNLEPGFQDSFIGKIAAANLGLDTLSAADSDILAVSPEKCPVGANNLCSVNVAWKSAVDASATNEIWVKDLSKNEFKLMSCLRAGSATATMAPWIAKGKTVEFRLYKTAGCPSSLPSGPPAASASVEGVADISAPRVLITKPIPDDQLAIKKEQEVFAVASDDVAVTKTVLLVDGAERATITVPPYRFTLLKSDMSTLQTGCHQITVRAYDAAGHLSESSIAVNGKKFQTNPCEKTASPH